MCDRNLIRFTFTLLALFVAEAMLLAQNARAEKIIGRVLNGFATTDQTPWMVSLQILDQSGYTHICGGTLISKDTVPTAAHCLNEFKTTPQQLSVYVGSQQLSSSQGSRYEGRGVIIDPGYDDVNLNHDIGLLKIRGEVALPEFPEVATPEEFATVGTTSVKLYGWGVIYADVPVRPDLLQEATLPLISDSECETRLGLDFHPDSMLCAGVLSTNSTSDDGRDACSGDSGGPLVAIIDGKVKVVGIVSWGFGCGSPKVYGVYTRASAFGAWIRSNPGVPPFPISEPEISGLPQDSATLTCQRGEWGGDGELQFTYSWLDLDMGELPGKTSSKLKLGRSDVGRKLSCVVTAVSEHGSMEATSGMAATVFPKAGGKKTSQHSLRAGTAGRFCSGKSCSVLYNVGQSVRVVRAVIVPTGGRAKGVAATLNTKTTVIMTVKKSFRGSVVFRIITTKGKALVKEIRI